MEKLKNALISRGIKPTYQRIKILEYLEKNKNHPTVEMIYNALYKKAPTLSKTTVYNTLEVFRKNGLLNVMTITGSELRYDINTEPHHHFLCRECGRIFDMNIKCPYLEKAKTAEHKIEEIHGYFKGICKDCLAKEKKQSRQ